MIKLLKDIFKKTPDFNKSSLETNPFLIRKMDVQY